MELILNLYLTMTGYNWKLTNSYFSNNSLSLAETAQKVENRGYTEECHAWLYYVSQSYELIKTQAMLNMRRNF